MNGGPAGNVREGESEGETGGEGGSGGREGRRALPEPGPVSRQVATRRARACRTPRRGPPDLPDWQAWASQLCTEPGSRQCGSARRLGKGRLRPLAQPDGRRPACPSARSQHSQSRAAGWKGFRTRFPAGPLQLSLGRPHRRYCRSGG